MKALILLILIHLAARGIAKAEISNYPFPVKDAYQATLLNAASAYMVNYAPPYRDYEKTFYKSRSKLAFLGNRNSVPFRFYPQKHIKSAPLTFVIGGLGSTATSGSNEFYAKILHKFGHNVISVASPFFWKFNLAYMNTATPGYTPDDSLELYEYLKQTLKVLRFKVDDFPQVNLSGYSLGALEASFMADRDQAERYFNFSKVVLVNPPISVYNSGTKLDEMFSVWASMSEFEQKIIEKTVLSIVFQLSDENLDMAKVQNLLLNFPVTSTQSKALIGLNFRKTLSEVVFVSELINERGLFPLYKYQKSPQPALQGAANFGYQSYFDNILLPSLKTNLSIEEVYRSMSLNSKANYLQRAENLTVFHNLDDVILKPGDIEFLKENLGDRLKLYPLGGHLGNIWFPPNVSDYLAAFVVKN